MILTPEEMADAIKYGETLKDEHVVECLRSLVEREQEFLTNVGDDAELREILLHNITCLAAAAARLTPDQTPLPEAGTPTG